MDSNPTMFPQIHVVLVTLLAMAAATGETCVATLRRDATLPHLRRVCEACACARCDHTCVAVHTTWRTLDLAPPCAARLTPDLRRSLGIVDLQCTARKRTRAAPTTTTTTMITRRLGPSAPPLDSMDGCTLARRDGDSGVEVWRCEAGASAEDGDVVSRRPRTWNAWSAAAQHTDGPAAAPSALDGAGQVIGTIDTGVALQACYFRDALTSAPYYDCEAGAGDGAPPLTGAVSQPARRKVVQYVRSGGGTSSACGDGADLDGHGSHTAGTLAGAAWCAPRTCTARMDAMRGVAHAAQLAVYDAGPDADGYLLLPSDLRHAIAWAQRAGAKVHSNSWGSDAGGFYDMLAFDVDRACTADPELVVVVAAGNLDSPSDPQTHVTSPGLAKNALTVGATYAAAEPRERAYCGGAAAYSPNAGACAAISTHPAGTRAWYSRYGAAGPSRAKPEVVAPGSVVWSARNDGACAPGDDDASPFGSGAAVVPLQGTSMATPQVAGAAALLRQYFGTGMYPCGAAPNASRAWPVVPSALVIATLILSTGSDAPDTQTGYGTPRVPAVTASAFEVLSGATPSSARVAETGAVHTWAVCALAARATAVLVWTDSTAVFVNSPTTGTLVNDLDLTLLDASTSAVVSRSADRATPRERVVVTDLSPGRWYTVSVSAARIAGGAPQPFALVVSGLSATGCDASRACDAAASGAPAGTSGMPVALLADPGSDHVVWSLPTFEVAVTHPSLDASGGGGGWTLVAQHLTVAQAEARCGGASLNDTSAATFALWNTSAVVVDTLPPTVTVTGAVWHDTVVWKRQRLLFCADDGSGTWTDVTSTETGGDADLVFVSDVPVRVYGVPPATNGTYARVDWHEGDWDTVCMPGWTGCGCGLARPAGSATWFAMRLIALVLAWMLMGALVFRPTPPPAVCAAAAVALVSAAHPDATTAGYATAVSSAVLTAAAGGGSGSRPVAALGLATSLASVAVATATAWQSRDPYADTATPTTALVAVTTLAAVAAARIPDTAQRVTGVICVAAVGAAALQRQDAVAWFLAPLAVVLGTGKRWTAIPTHVALCVLVLMGTVVPTCQVDLSK